MKTKTVMLYITLLASCFTVSAQNPINVVVTGACAILSSTYNYDGLQNGKNRYVKQFELENTIFNVYVRFDGTYWLLNNSEDIEYSLLFYNINTSSIVPPNDNWERGGCPDGTMRIETVLGVDVLDSKAISLLPNPSNNFI